MLSAELICSFSSDEINSFAGLCPMQQALLPPAPLSPALPTARGLMQAAPTRSKEDATAAIPKCEQGHLLELSSREDISPRCWVCDVCTWTIKPGHNVSYVCTTCDFDMCLMCAAGKIKENTKPELLATAEVFTAPARLMPDMSAAHALANTAVALAQKLALQNGSAAVCATGLAAVAGVLASAVTDAAPLLKMVGAADANGVAQAMAGQELDHSDWGCHGIAVVMAPRAKSAFLDCVSGILGAKNIHFSPEFDRSALDAAVCRRTKNLVTQAFSGESPRNICVVVCVVNVFAAVWAEKPKQLDEHQFVTRQGKQRTCRGMQFSGLFLGAVTPEFTGAAVKYNLPGCVFAFFVQPNEACTTRTVDVYAFAKHLYTCYDYKLRYDVCVPEFKVDTKMDLQATFGLDRLSLPGVADDAELGLLQQSVTLKCSKEGTVAASATTAVATYRGGGPRTKTVCINRPFVFLIARCDEELGLVPLFVAAVDDVA